MDAPKLSITERFKHLREALALREIDEKLTRAAVDLNQVQAEIDLVHGSKPVTGKTKLDGEVEAYLSGEGAPTVALGADTRREKLLELYHRRTLLNEAARRLRQARLDANSKLSRVICKELRPDAVAIMRSLAAAAVQLATAIDAERDFFEALRDSDISFASWLPREIFPHVGSLRDSNSNVRFFLKVLAEEYSEVEAKLPEAAPGYAGAVRSNGTVAKLPAVTPVRRPAVDISEWTSRA